MREDDMMDEEIVSLDSMEDETTLDPTDDDDEYSALMRNSGDDVIEELDFDNLGLRFGDRESNPNADEDWED